MNIKYDQLKAGLAKTVCRTDNKQQKPDYATIGELLRESYMRRQKKPTPTDTSKPEN